MGNRKVLFIGAHPDDIDLGCAVSMLFHHKKNDEIATIVITNGEKGGSPSMRLAEQNESFEILAPGSENNYLHLPDTKLFIHMQEIIAKIREIALRLKPDIVFIPSQFDFHQDHVVTHMCAMAVFNNVKAHRILCYETPSTMADFAPDFYKVCDWEEFEVKLDALKCHKTQINKPYFSEDTIISIAKMRASQARRYSEFSEAYQVIRIVEEGEV